MLTAPTYGPQRANIAAVPGVRQDANRTPQEYGADFGGVVQAAGKLGEEVYVNQSITRSQAEANGARAKLSQSASVFMQRKGASARGLTSEAEKAWQEEDARVRESLAGNPISIQAWDKQAPSMREAFLNPIRNHEADQVFAADTETKKLALAGTQQEAARNYGTPAYESTKESLRLQASDLAGHIGRDQKDAQFIADQAVQGANSQAIDLAIDAKNFPEAMKRFDALKNDISPTDRAKFEGILSVHANQQRVFDVGIVAAQAAVPKPPEKAGWRGQGPGMQEVTGEEYATEYAKYLHAPANELAAYAIIDEAIKNGKLPANQREEAVTQMRNYIKADADRRKAVVDSAFSELSNAVVDGTTVANATAGNPSAFAVLSPKQKEDLYAMEERAVARRPSQLGALDEAHKLSPDQLIAQASAYKAALNTDDWKVYSKLLDDARSGKRTADLVKSEVAIIDEVAERLALENGVKKDQLDAQKMDVVNKLVRRAIIDAREGGKGTSAWTDPGLYTEVASKAYKNTDDALTVRMMQSYDRRNSESKPLVDAFTDPQPEKFTKAVENLKVWASDVELKYESRPIPQDAYSIALSTLTGMNFDQLQQKRLEQQALDKAAGRVRTFSQIEHEIIQEAANKVKVAPTLLGRVIGGIGAAASTVVGAESAMLSGMYRYSGAKMTADAEWAAFSWAMDKARFAGGYYAGMQIPQSVIDFINQPGLGAPPEIRR